MRRLDGRKSEYIYTNEPSDQQLSFEERSPQQPSPKGIEQFSYLYVAREHFLAFVTELGDKKNLEMREDILNHCEQGSKKERAFQIYLNDQMILRLINLRIQKMLKNKRIKKNWSDEDVKILIWIISKYSDLHGLRDAGKDLERDDWIAISSLIPGVKPQSCMFKWLSLKKTNLATNNWSEEESNCLGNLVRQTASKNHKKDTRDWKFISQTLYFSSNMQDKIYRNAKQCRQHWNCYLNPRLKKGPWKPQEDVLLLKCIKQNRGSKKWSQIVRYFDGRTQNALKNRYTLIIQKQKKQQKHKSELEIIQDYLEKNYVDQFTVEINQEYSDEQKEISGSFMIIEAPTKQINDQPKRKKCQESVEQIEENIMNNSEQNINTIMSPIKVELIDFKILLEMGRIQLKYIQPGILLNGVFQRSMNCIDQTEIEHSINRLQIKQYKSSLLRLQI